MSTDEVKVRAQHYVWRHYLSSWAVGDKIWCARNGKYFHPNPANVAQQTDFYRLKEMSQRDIDVVVALIGRFQPELRAFAHHWISLFSILFECNRAYIASNKTDLELEKQLDIAINNLEEYIHRDIEARAQRFLLELKSGDVATLLDSETFAEFSLFLMMQNVRTPGVLARMVGIPDDGLHINMEATAGVFRMIIATNTSFGLWKGRHDLRVSILDAPTGGQFVTGDQPTVNTFSVGLRHDEPPNGVEIYYPVSPSRATLFTFGNSSPGIFQRQLTKQETDSFNRIIANKANDSIYGATREAVVDAWALRSPPR